MTPDEHASRRGTRLRDGRVAFGFDGRPLLARSGDSAAAALIANGIAVVARSTKYRRARGVFSADDAEPSALLTAVIGERRVPNCPVGLLEVTPGLQLLSQRGWPSVRRDAGAALGLAGGLLSAGFYYKTFMWPSWRAYEPLIRRLAGLGPAPSGCAREPSIEHAACDVLVVGAGAAGLCAARSAAAAGARVIVCESAPVIGGELEFESAQIDGVPAMAWVGATGRLLSERGGSILTSTTAIGVDGDVVVAHRDAGDEAPGVSRLRARSIVLAVGALEQPIAFCDNDRPGVMLLGAAERLLAGYGVRAAERPVLFGAHDRLYDAAQRLLGAGVRVQAVIDLRGNPDSAGVAALAGRGVRCLPGHGIVATHGRGRVASVDVAPLARLQPSMRIACDGVFVSGGWVPRGLGWPTQGTLVPAICGAANSRFDLCAATADGAATGLAAARALGVAGGEARVPECRGDAAPAPRRWTRVPASRTAERRQFVDLQNDVTVADLRQAIEEGFRDIEHAKRYTTLGVGTDQGRSGGALGAAIVAELSDREPAEARPSRSRPPFRPASIDVLAGRTRGPSLRPERRTALHDWHASNGGVLENAGLWRRPRFYRASGPEASSAGIREARRVRTHGGIFDASTLGKVEVAGADAAEFLDRLYLSRASAIPVGRSRYMVMLREDGMVLDDGLVLRLAPDRFLATISSGHQDLVLAHVEYRRALEFGRRAVDLADVTDGWAVLVVAGPQSREALRNVLGPSWTAVVDGLRHMQFETRAYEGGPLRLLRASFSGELAFEVHCRPAAAVGLWESLRTAGLAPYGLESLDVLRIEKGYPTSSELNGQTTPHDVGLEGMLRTGNPCVGRELLGRPALHEGRRPRLVGLRSGPKAPFRTGAQLTPPNSLVSCGHVTAATFSPSLDAWIGLAFVARDQPLGTRLVARDPLRNLETEVLTVAPVQFDPDGSRMKS